MANNITTNIKTWSSTLGSNQPDGSDLFSSLPDDLRAIQAAVRTWYEDSEWTDFGNTPTRTGATTFTLAGDQTAQYKAGRGIRCTDGASTFYGIITSSVFTTLTTVTVALDSGALTASLSAVALGIDNSGGSIRTGITPSLGDSSNKLATTGFVVNTAFTGQLPGQTGNAGKFLTTNGSIASWAQADLTTGVTGVLPVANGGTGVATITGIVKGNGTGAMTAAVANTDYQSVISASGLLKGAGAGSISAAVAGTDYQAAISASGLLKGAGAGSVSAAVSGTDIKTVNGFSLIGSGNITSGTRSFTATGTIASAGIAVALRNDGTVSAIAGNLSSDVTFSSALHLKTDACYVQSTGSVVVAYYDNSLSIKVVVGTVSGGTISFGSAATITGVSAIYGLSIAAQPSSGKVLVYYFTTFSGSTANYAAVGTISGSSITFGTPVLGTTWGAVPPSMALEYDVTNDKFVYAHSLNAASSYAYSGVLTINGTSATFSSPVQFHATATQSDYIAAAYDTTNSKIVLFYNRSNVVYAVVGTISAGVLSWGTEVTCYSGRGYYLSACYDSFNGKVALAFVNTATDSQCRVIIGTVSGTTISFGTAVVASANTTVSTSLVYDSTNKKILLTYGYNDAPIYVKAVTGTISGTTVTFGTPVNISPSGYSASDALAIAYDPGTNSAVVAYKGVSNFGNARVSSMSSGDFNLGLTNFIGISEASATNGQAVTITTLGGVNTNVSGLSAGSKYYVDSAGALTTSAVSGVEAGKALSATSLLVTGG